MEDDLWTSPSKDNEDSKINGLEDPASGAGRSHSRSGDSKFEKQASKDELLRNELESVRKVNDAIEGVIESLDKAKSSMSVSPLTVCTCPLLTMIAVC